MKTCGTCKHWKPIATEPYDLNEGSQYPPGCGHCQAVEHPEGFETDGGSNKAYEELRKKKNAHKTAAKAYVEDGSGYYAALICKTDFGCVLHEEKQ